MARPPMPLGSWGNIRRTRVGGKRWMADALFRDYDGRTRRVERRADTGPQAEKLLKEHLLTRSRAGRLGEIRAETHVRDVGNLWLEGLREEGRAAATLQSYADTLRLHVIPALGLLQVREVTVGVSDRFLVTVKNTAGPSAARHARTVLSGLMGLAARHEAVRANPVRDVSKIVIERDDARSLLLEEVRTLRAGLRVDPVAVGRDLPDLVDFMLGTGLRIGETLAVTESALDLVTGQVEVRGTVQRIKDKGLVIQPKPKTRKGWRRLHLPPWLIEVMKQRPAIDNEWGVVFVSQQGKLRERSNTNADIREALDPLGFGWVTTHTFRKTAATLLDDGGLTVREIADQLGHRRVSVTQDTYFGRHQGSPKVADALDVIGRPATDA
jgi:integrase